MNNIKKKKIVYLITKANWGGAQKYVFDLATSLSREQFDVLVLHGEGDILNKRLQEAGIRTKKINQMGRDISILSEVVVSLKILKTLFYERPDVVHLNSSKAAGLGALVSRILFIPKIIFTVHGWAFNEPRFSNGLTKFLSWLTVLLSTKTIVISKENLQQVSRWPLVKDRFKLVYNGITEIKFRERESSREFISNITHTNKNKIWLATVSELHENKGLEYLIEAISKLKETPILFIIGDGEERDNLERQIEGLNLGKNIFLMGFIENASSYLKAFDIFTLTSIKEGLPYVLLEAGLSESPVVVSKIPGITDIVNSKSGVSVESKNAKAIAVAIQNLIDNPQKRAQLGSGLMKGVKKKFSLEKMLRETTSLY